METDKKSINVCCISDTHGLHSELVLPAADVLIHAGDFTNYGELERVTEFLSWYREQPAPIKLLTCGNHEVEISHMLPVLRDACEEAGVHLLINSGMTLPNGMKAWGSPCCPRYGRGWAFMREDDDLNEVWNQIPWGVDILITHGPPYEVLDLSETKVRCGSQTLRRMVELVQPQLHVFGHIHEGTGSVLLPDGYGLAVNASLVNRRCQNSGKRQPALVQVSLRESGKPPVVLQNPRITPPTEAKNAT